MATFSSSLSPLSVDTLAAYRHTYLYSPGGSAIMRDADAPEGVPPLFMTFGDGTLSEEEWREAILSGNGALPEHGDDLMPCGRPSGLHAPRAHSDLPACCEHALAAAGAPAVAAAAAVDGVAAPQPGLHPLVAALFAQAAAGPMPRLPSPHSVPELAIDAARAEREEGEIILSPHAVAVQAAEAVLAEAPAEPDGVAPPGGAAAEPEDWCFSVTVSDLALPLDLRHPRVVLALFRFVESYNMFAPADEEINMPKMPLSMKRKILGHISVTNPAPEFADDIADLLRLVESQPQEEAAEAVASVEGEDAEDWCVSVTVSDLALSLDMRSPIVLLQFLRFVDLYNEIAPADELISLPVMTYDDRMYLLEHYLFADVPPHFKNDVDELWDRVARHECVCRDCRIAECGYASDSTRGYDSD